MAELTSQPIIERVLFFFVPVFLFVCERGVGGNVLAPNHLFIRKNNKGTVKPTREKFISTIST